MENSRWLDNFLDMYRQLGTDDFGALQDVYHQQIEFTDPLHQVNGLDALTRYFENIYTNVATCKFTIISAFESGEQAAVYWSMEFTHKQLNGRKPIIVEGHSHLTMKDGLVISHRDYLDVGAMLYEHVPILGCAVKSIKRRASQ